MLKWSKFGLVFSASGQYSWLETHAQNPISLHLENNLFRIFFTSRDKSNYSYITYLDFDIETKQVTKLADHPILRPGPLGHFDEHGVLTSSIVKHEQKLYLYYTGWVRGFRKSQWYGTIGLAISQDGGETFNKVSPSPILARSRFDPCLVASPHVLFDQESWKMWYVSGFKWEEKGDILNSLYHIKYARSLDGIYWERSGLVCIDHFPGEKNIGKPCVLKDDKLYKMWYPYSSLEKGYRIGYAESFDGYLWVRKDAQVKIDVSLEGWDSKMMAYPWVFKHNDKSYMLYNGNNFGREGFGLAIAQ